MANNLLATFLLLAIWASPVSADSLSGGSCDAQSAHASRMEKLMMEKLPSVLDECGIGGVFDICGKFGGILAKALDVDCGDGGGSKKSSNFCGVDFSMDDLKDLYPGIEDKAKDKFKDLFGSASQQNDSLQHLNSEQQRLARYKQNNQVDKKAIAAVIGVDY